jgi:hypothetical protein
MNATSNRYQVSIEADPTLPIIRMTRDFDATPAQLMRAHTDPELFARWVGPNGLQTKILDWDATTGGRWRYVARRDGEEYGFHGCFHEVGEDRIADLHVDGLRTCARDAVVEDSAVAPGHAAAADTRAAPVARQRHGGVTSYVLDATVGEPDERRPTSTGAWRRAPATVEGTPRRRRDWPARLAARVSATPSSGSRPFSRDQPESRCPPARPSTPTRSAPGARRPTPCKHCSTIPKPPTANTISRTSEACRSGRPST